MSKCKVNVEQYLNLVLITCKHAKGALYRD